MGLLGGFSSGGVRSVRLISVAVVAGGGPHSDVKAYTLEVDSEDGLREVTVQLDPDQTMKLATLDALIRAINRSLG